jgi:feruloyl esterase
VGLTTEQLDLVSNAAIAACDVVGGQHLGYILDPSTCQYDPTIDPTVLCSASGGNNSSAACVSRVQATAVNKIWYGMTSDGSVPSPATDNGWLAASAPALPSGTQRWFGMARGTSLYLGAFYAFGADGLASPRGIFSLPTDQVALTLQNPTYADPTFVNATGTGAGLWKTLSYPQLSNAFDRGLALQPLFGNINTDNPDLAPFNARNGKLLHWHGLADELIMPQGSVNYYNRVLAQMGGLANVQPFYRLFLMPAVGHGPRNGTSNSAANNPVARPQQLYRVMTDWVEKGVAPDSIILTSLSSTPTAKSQPVCAYPKKATYGGTGDPNAATSYSCM